MLFLLELWRYAKVRKKLWLLPLFVVILLLSFLIALTQVIGLSPLIYTVF